MGDKKARKLVFAGFFVVVDARATVSGEGRSAVRVIAFLDSGTYAMTCKRVAAKLKAEWISQRKVERIK